MLRKTRADLFQDDGLVMRIGRQGSTLHRYDAVVVAASAGGVTALQKLISGLPPDFPIPMAVVQHRTSRHPQMLANVLARHAAIPVRMAKNGEVMQPGTVYLASPDFHMAVRSDRSLAFLDGRKIRHVRSSANPLFESAALSLGGRVVPLARGRTAQGRTVAQAQRARAAHRHRSATGSEEESEDRKKGEKAGSVIMRVLGRLPCM